MKQKQISKFTLPERLKFLRNGRKLSQKQLAEQSDVSQSTIAQIETGKKDPSITTLRKLADALNIEIAIFFVSEDVHVFDMNRLTKKYKSCEDLHPTIYVALDKVIRYARSIGFIE